MTLQRSVPSVAAAFLTLDLGMPTTAAAGIDLSVLSCNVASRWGFILGSSPDLQCVYAPRRPSPSAVAAASPISVSISVISGTPSSSGPASRGIAGARLQYLS